MWGGWSRRREQHIQKPRGKRHEGALPFLEAAGSRKPYPWTSQHKTVQALQRGRLWASSPPGPQPAATEPTCGPAASPGSRPGPGPAKLRASFPGSPAWVVQEDLPPPSVCCCPRWSLRLRPFWGPLCPYPGVLGSACDSLSCEETWAFLRRSISSHRVWEQAGRASEASGPAHPLRRGQHC